MNIAGRKIGPDEPCFIIAEISGNHDKSYARADELVRAAKEAGADAVKIQSYTADCMTLDCIDQPTYKGQKLYDLYQSVAFDGYEDWHEAFKDICEAYDIPWLSSPFSIKMLDDLERVGCCAYKIASFEACDYEFVKAVADCGKPVIISTGCLSVTETRELMDFIDPKQTALLKCVSEYPAEAGKMSLKGMSLMQRLYDVPVGISDHSTGIGVSVAAVSLGACLVEKHITLSKDSIDGAFALMPEDFKNMVDTIRDAEKALNGTDTAGGQELRRSLYVVKDLKCGDAITRDNVRSIRPGNGLAPKFLPQILGKQLTQNVERGTPFQFKLIGGQNECTPRWIGDRMD